MSFDILKASNNITGKYLRYLKTMFDIDNPEYKGKFDERMEELESFSKGPFLDVIDSFESGKSVKQLIDDGILNSDFEYVESIYNKTLYKHQEVSVLKASYGKNIVVSTGTGSGKTESFLIPVLNSIMEEKKKSGGLTPGVRALLIYPMNALANDQISRLRKLLKDYPHITFGSYTGQTEEKYNKALSKYKSLNNNKTPLKNELISREQMKDTPPHILITNYSMLEYLMLRPKDNSLFQGKYSKYWKFVVLDEAHTYSGSTGIEVSMLLRRLKAYLDNPDLQFILTSATLGSENTNEEVATFASRLCDSPFSSDDIIRATRVNYSQITDNSISLSAETYKEMNDIISSGYSDDKVFEMLKSYLDIIGEEPDYYEYLFNVLMRDNTFWRIKRFLSDPQSVKDLCQEIGWDNDSISAFVNVASKASKNDKKLFDARYHMFIRATDGVFITLGNHKDLSLTRQTKKFVGDSVYRYFEACTCNHCHTLYLLGSVESEDGVKCLKQKANYSSDSIREAFYIGDVVNDEDEDSKLEDEHLVVTKYELCPHCGFIREKNQVHKTKCSHPETDYVPVTKVKQSELTGRVTKCIKCEGVNSMGVLRPFFSGQEASTSVVGTALFEELPSAEVHSVSTSADDSGFDFDDGFEVSVEKQYEKKAKQFIAFSDNRQAAAYYATYFSETYQGFLYSRVINNGIRKIDESGRSLSNFAKDITTDFRKNRISELFDDSPDYSREAWKAIMKELIQSNSRNSLMGLGLMKLGFSDGVNMPSNSKYGLSSDDVFSICQVLIRSMLEDNAIIAPYSFVESDIEFYSNNGSEKAYNLTSDNTFVRSFVPKNDTATNKRFDYVQRVFSQKGIDIEHGDIIRFLQAIWERLLVGQDIVIDRHDHSGKQVNLSKLSVINTSRWYRCPKCHRITAYNVADVCPAYKCDGVLESIDIETLEKENHYYRIYNDLDIQPLRVVEHTAQLNSEEAYRLQEKFKNQEIDVLSCSTTFEMGVDIGDLETVFMRNMPPTPSNYIQRAGRAGRSTKSAALALTFCNKSNHDFSYFKDPVSMINGEIQPPLFKVENEKIGIRHLYSAALAFFWRERSDFFGQVKDFFGDETPGDGYYSFVEYLEGKPNQLKDYLLKAMPKELVRKYEIESFGWSKWLFDEPNSMYPNLRTVYELYRDEVDSLYREKIKLEADNKSNYSIIRRINTYTKENVISFLSRNNILPKYGFPVDSVELTIASDKDNKTLPIELSRDLGMAISEYAPGCEVVAAGHLIRSRYIKRVPSKSWRQYDYGSCDSCNTISIALHLDSKEEQSLQKCEHCGTPFSSGSIGTFIIPEFGFVSEKNIAKPSLIKPERTYRTEASIVAEGNTTHKGQYTIGSLTVDAVTMEDGEIAILNKSDFFICPMCGYSLSEHEAKSYGQIHKKEHQNPSGYKCKNEVLQKYSLGYRFKTDVLHLSLDDTYRYDEAYSILQAIILSACKTLNLDNNEISGCLQYRLNDSGSTYDFMLYDTTPGGAGHVRRIANESNIAQVFTEAYHRAKNCDCGGEEGDVSCYKCLRTYQNQQYHDLIKRKYVFSKLQLVEL